MQQKRDAKSLGGNGDAPRPKRQKTEAPAHRIPPEFICPITGQIMLEPWIAEDSFTYEKFAIEKWFKTSNLSPLTGLKISNKLIFNRALKESIQGYLSRNEKNAAIQAEVFDGDYYHLERIEAILPFRKVDLNEIIENVRKLKDKLKIFELSENYPQRIFYLACVGGSIEQIKYIHEILIKKNNDHLKDLPAFKCNQLCYACASNKGDAVKYLIELLGENAKAMLQRLPPGIQNLAQVICKNPNHAEVVNVLSSSFGDLIPNTLNEDIQKELDLIKQRNQQQQLDIRSIRSGHPERSHESALSRTEFLLSQMASLPLRSGVNSSPTQAQNRFFPPGLSQTEIIQRLENAERVFTTAPRYQSGQTRNDYVNSLKIWVTCRREQMLNRGAGFYHFADEWPRIHRKLNRALDSIREPTQEQASWDEWKNQQIESIHNDFNEELRRLQILQGNSFV